MRPEQTRKQAAAELLERVRRGPAWGPTGGTIWTARHVKEATEGYQRWAESWIIPVLERLVPELAPARAGAPPAIARQDRRTESVSSWAISEARCLQLRMAGYAAQATDMGRAIVIHIAPGKHADLSKLPAPASGGE